MIFSMILDPSTNSSRQLTGRSIASRMAVLGLAAGLVLTGCSKTESIDSVETSEQQALNQASEEAVLGQGRDDEPTTSGKQPAADGTEVALKPVSYDVKNWEASTGEMIGVEDLSQIQAMFGKVTVTDENSLDYASNTAVKYRFMKGEQPYLDIIDSQKYLEFGWYYANPGDSDSEKDTSIKHAKKVYKAATALMGEQGGQLVTSMLSGQIIKNKVIEGKRVQLAKCEFYSCMLILDKDA